MLHKIFPLLTLCLFSTTTMSLRASDTEEDDYVRIPVTAAPPEETKDLPDSEGYDSMPDEGEAVLQKPGKPSPLLTSERLVPSDDEKDEAPYMRARAAFIYDKYLLRLCEQGGTRADVTAFMCKIQDMGLAKKFEIAVRQQLDFGNDPELVDLAKQIIVMANLINRTQQNFIVGLVNYEESYSHPQKLSWGPSRSPSVGTLSEDYPNPSNTNERMSASDPRVNEVLKGIEEILGSTESIEEVYRQDSLSLRDVIAGDLETTSIADIIQKLVLQAFDRI